MNDYEQILIKNNKQHLSIKFLFYTWSFAQFNT